jgi:GNAT superfamily N-acetyltransferase
MEEIHKALDTAAIMIAQDSIISTGVLAGAGGAVSFDVYAGWNLSIARLCDRAWGTFNVELLRQIRKIETSGKDVTQILDSAQLEDHHWRWLDKTLHYRGDNYKWFFLFAENYPQAACLIYHPKKSVVGAGDIFYVEYIAAAPWNRDNVLAERIFKGVGPKLLDSVITYTKDKLNLRPGFSLHSLPKAVSFYEKIGMTCFDQYDKDGLKFFEWAEPAIDAGK